MKTIALITAAALALGLAACGKKEEPPKTAEAPAPTTAPAPPTQAAPPSPSVPTSSVVPRNFALGNAIGADKKVMVPLNVLAKGDTAYVSVDLFGAGDAKVMARWTYKGADGKVVLVKEEAQKLNVTTPATIEFHVSKPDGWPAGGYEAEISVNDVSAGKKGFSVK
jgi:hypothetical protein